MCPRYRLDSFRCDCCNYSCPLTGETVTQRLWRRCNFIDKLARRRLHVYTLLCGDDYYSCSSYLSIYRTSPVLICRYHRIHTDITSESRKPEGFPTVVVQRPEQLIIGIGATRVRFRWYSNSPRVSWTQERRIFLYDYLRIARFEQ